jgi:diadenosine tetraphosphate (Ap4A) HIT family hydrolase
VTTERRVAWDTASYLRRVRAACFVCEMLAGSPGYEHHIVHRDDIAVAFLSKYPVAHGHTLVAPIEHREHVIGDFSPDDYSALQRVVHAAGNALTATIDTERLYVLSLGSQQGHRHVHWHLVPLPPGVPYVEQRTALFDEDRGWLHVEPADQEKLADQIRAALARPSQAHAH